MRKANVTADIHNEKLIARYLLGELPEKQQVELEDRAFQDKEYLATITAVEQPTGGRWIPNFDPSQVVRSAWGTLTFTFTDFGAIFLK